jgi:hypothetical protein
MSQTARRAGIIAIAAISALVSADESGGISAGRRVIDIFFSSENEPKTVWLDSLTPAGDSCAELIVDFPRSPGAWACFRYATDRAWNFENAGSYKPFEAGKNIKVITSSDHAGRFLKAVITIDREPDSLMHNRGALLRRGDVPVVFDSSASFDFIVKRTVYCCLPGCKKRIEARKYVYPPGYMRREPAPLNYPELSMFHYGYSVRLPTASSVNARGFVVNYWHILHPDELEYDDGGVKRNIGKRKK